MPEREETRFFAQLHHNSDSYVLCPNVVLSATVMAMLYFDLIVSLKSFLDNVTQQ